MTVDRSEPASLPGLAVLDILILLVMIVLVVVFAVFSPGTPWYLFLWDALFSLGDESIPLKLTFGFVGIFIIAGLLAAIGYLVELHCNSVLFHNTWELTEGTVFRREVEVHESDYGAYKGYYLFISFNADERSDRTGDKGVGERTVSLKASVSQVLYDSLAEGESVGVRYSSSSSEIAVIEGEW